MPGSINGFSNNACTNMNMQQRNFQTQHSNSTNHYNPLYGVPFQINPIYDTIKINNGTNNEVLVRKIKKKILNRNI